MGFALSLDTHHPPSQQEEALSLENSLCSLGKRGKYLCVRVKCHVEFIKKEYRTSLLPPLLQVSPLCYPDPTQDSEVDVQLRTSLACGMAAAVGKTFLPRSP